MTPSTSGCCRTTPTPGPNVTGGAPPTYQADTAPATAVRAWAGRAEARHAEPDEAYVTRLCPHHETSVQVSGPPGSWDYRQSAHLTEPGVGAYPPPPEPGVPGLRGQVRMLNRGLDQAGLAGALDLAARFEELARTVRHPRRSITRRLGCTVPAGPGPRGIRGATRRA